MTGSTPRALICGIDHFVGKKLVKRLTAEEIEVTDISEGNFNYIFDFTGDREVWQKAKEEGSKLTIICVDNKRKAERLKNELQQENFNWRLVESYNVYGEGMEKEDFLFRAINQAVRNNNLVLPTLDIKYRILGVDDLVEAILKANFISGTEKEEFLVLGKKIDSEEVARVLIDEAKMTKYKVVQEETEIQKWNDEEVEENWKKLRWRPEIEFKEGIKGTLQYFFSKVDEENRNKKKELPPKKNWEVIPVIVEPKKPKKKKTFEVFIEEEEEKKEIVKPERLERIKIIEAEEEENEVVEEDNLVNVDEPKTLTKTKEEESQNKKKKEKKKPKIEYKKIFLALVILIIVFTPLNWFFTTYFSAKNILAVESLVGEKKYDKAETVSKRSFQRIKNIDEKIDEMGINRIGFVRNYQMILKTIKDVLLMEEKSIAIVRSSEKISEAVFNMKSVDWNGELGELKTNLSTIQDQIGILQARMKGNWSWVPGKWKDLPIKASKKLEEVKAVILPSSKILDVLPEFLGMDGKKREYLVIFQNENELRPTGGFIGSYAILTFQKGKLVNFDIQDIYEADGQLKGHVEPPTEIRDYLGEAGWFMRDANWNPNFPETSKDLQWFLEKETGRKVDGVIGLNLATVKAILEVTGEIFVPDFNEKINKNNLYEQAEFYSETKFFPGSKQKASFLGGLGKQLFEEIKNLKAEKRAILYKSVINLLENKEIQISLNDKKTDDVFGSLGWNGVINQGKCSGERCYADYLYLVEANLGVNKANYFLYRKIDQTVEIKDQSIDRVLKINYENTAKNTSWPGGDYKNYLRIYLPTDVSVTEVNIADSNDPNSKRVYGTDEIKINDTNGKREVGILVTVPVNSKRTVEIKYTSPINLNSEQKNFSYLDYIQKQSGFGETNLVTLMSFPKDWQLVQVQPEASLIDGKLLFNQKLEKDLKMGVEIGK